MAQQHYSTRRRKFQHLTQEKRAQIEILLRLKMPKSQIAREVGIARSTLYNELALGSVEQIDSQLRTYKRYFHDAGQRMYEEHRRNSRPPLKLAKAHEFITYAEKQMLEEKLAPDPICGEARRSGRFQETVCAKTLYNYINQCLLKVRNIDLLLKVKRKPSGSGHPQHKRLYGMSIEQRPERINRREEFGHWEIDTVVGNAESSAVLLTLDERTTRYRHILKISNRSTQAVAQGLKQLRALYGERFNCIFRSITSDNGSEFAALPEQLPETPIYYAHPYSSYERGLNEKQNSLIRRFFSKGHSLDAVSHDAVQRVQDWINRFPRKAFRYATPDSLFQAVLFDIAI